jgi:tetratricopeptide (TPR) repeat protein
LRRHCFIPGLLGLMSLGINALPVSAQNYGASSEGEQKSKARLAYIQGQNLAQQGKSKAAIRAIQQSYALYPTAGSLYALGILYEQTDETAEAIRSYEAALVAPYLQANLKANVEARLLALGVVPSPEPRRAPATQRSISESKASAKDRIPTGWLTGSGLFVEGGGIFNLLVPQGGIWPAAAAGFGFPYGIIVRAEVMAPYATVNAGLAWEMLSTALRPFAWAQAGYAIVRSLQEDTSGGFIVSFGAGLKWYPWEYAGLWGAIRAGVALDMARERTSTPIPIMLSVGYEL